MHPPRPHTHTHTNPPTHPHRSAYAGGATSEVYCCKENPLHTETFRPWHMSPAEWSPVNTGESLTPCSFSCRSVLSLFQEWKYQLQAVSEFLKQSNLIWVPAAIVSKLKSTLTPPFQNRKHKSPACCLLFTGFLAVAKQHLLAPFLLTSTWQSIWQITAE